MENKKTGNFFNNIANAGLNAVDYASIKIDKFAEETQRILFLPATLYSEKFDKEVEDYLSEQTGYREMLVNNIKERRETLENYVQANPIRGAFLKPTYSLLEQGLDPIQILKNFTPYGQAANYVSKAGYIIFNVVDNVLDYLLEEKLLNDKEITEFGKEEYINLATSGALGGVISPFNYQKPTNLLSRDMIADEIFKIKTDNNKAPLDKAVELKEKIKNNVDFKIQGEIIERLESGQTQSLPKGFHNGERVLKTIKDGVMPRINKISEAYKDIETSSEYGRNPKLKNMPNRDVSTKSAIAETMKPVYTEIKLGQRQAMGEIANELVGWNIKNKQYDGITPIADIIKETTEGYTPEKFVSIIRGKAVEEKDIELGKILNKHVIESIEVKSQNKIFDKTEGYYFDTTINKQHFMHDLKELNDYLILEEDRKKFILGQLKDLGENIYLDDVKAKEYGYNKSGNYSMRENNNLLKELYLDINKTTDDYAKTYQIGSVSEKPMSLYEVALKWANMQDREKFNEIIEKETYKGEELRIKNFYNFGKKKYDEVLKKEKLSKKEKQLKYAYKKNLKKYNELIKTKKLTPEETIFKENYVKEALDKLASAFVGYEKKPEDILLDIFSTNIDERSGFNAFKNIFQHYISEPVSSNINNKFKTGIKPIDKAIGFILNIIADKDADTSIKEIAQSYYKNLRSINELKSRDYNELSLSDKTIYNLKNVASYKLLFGIRHLREFGANTAIINSGAINLGFKKQYSYIKSAFGMAKAHSVLAKKIDNILKEGLENIADPYDRLATEIFIRRSLENNYAFDKKSFAWAVSKAGKVGGAGQVVSDIHRIITATRMVTKAMKDEFINMTFDKMTPLMKNVLESNGIDDDIKLQALKDQIKSFKTQLEFDDWILNTDIENGGKIKSIFEQFVDIMGREFEPFEKDLTQITANNFVSKLWLDSTMLFKRYSMGAFSRTWKNATTFYDEDGILRYKFLKKHHLQWDSFSKDNWRNSLQGFGARKTINLMKMSSLLWASTQATSWAHGKLFGTSQDEVVEAKFEAMLEEPIPIIAEGITDSFTNYIGYDVMFGGTPALIGVSKETWNALGRDFTAEELSSTEKILYGFSYALTPSNVGRGIDNLKFEKAITPRLKSWSKDAQFLWKYYYKKDAELEQMRGEFPIEKAFETVTDWFEYFSKNPKQAEKIVGEITDENKKSKILLATGITELAEQSMRSEHINYAFTLDTTEEREESLRKFGLNYKTQLLIMDKEIRNLFNAIMAFKKVQDPLYLIQALEYVNSSKDKKQAVYSLLDSEDERLFFENFYKNIEKNPEKRKEVARMKYSDDTEGYVEFLNNLRNSY